MLLFILITTMTPLVIIPTLLVYILTWINFIIFKMVKFKLKRLFIVYLFISRTIFFISWVQSAYLALYIFYEIIGNDHLKKFLTYDGMNIFKEQIDKMHNSGKAFYALAFVCLFIWSFFVIFWGCLALRILFTLTDAEIYQEAERHVIPMDSKYQSDKVVLADSIQLDEERD